MAHTDSRGTTKLWSEDACKADVLQVLRDHDTDIDEAWIEPAASIDDVFLDAGELATFADDLETWFGLQIPIADTDAWETIADVQAYIWTRVRVRHPPSQIKPS